MQGVLPLQGAGHLARGPHTAPPETSGTPSRSLRERRRSGEAGLGDEMLEVKWQTVRLPPEPKGQLARYMSATAGAALCRGAPSSKPWRCARDMPAGKLKRVSETPPMYSRRVQLPPPQVLMPAWL